MRSKGNRLISKLGRRLAPDPTRHPSVWDSHEGVGTPLFERWLEPFKDIQLRYPDSSVDFGPLSEQRQREGAYYVDRPSDVLLREGWIVEQGPRIHERAQIASATRLHRPGLRRYLAEKALRPPERSLECAVSLRTRGDGNYFHILNDILGARVRLLGETNVPTDIPLLVSRNLAASPCFERIARTEALEGREIVVQQSGRVRVESVFYFESATLNVENARYAVQALGIPESDSTSGNRVLVVRRPPANRAFANAGEVEELAKRFGFKAVDPASLCFAEQIELFSGAAVVLGAHGAGLANVIFRRNASLHLVEVFERYQPPPPHYMVLSSHLGFRYTPLLCAGVTDGGVRQIVVDCDTLCKVLGRVCGS
jgi:hypothetical protein